MFFQYLCHQLNEFTQHYKRFYLQTCNMSAITEYFNWITIVFREALAIFTINNLCLLGNKCLFSTISRFGLHFLQTGKTGDTLNNLSTFISFANLDYFIFFVENLRTNFLVNFFIRIITGLMSSEISRIISPAELNLRTNFM